MTLKEEIQNLAKLEKDLRDSYLVRLIDFIKWTSTIALAAGLWIGTNFSKYVESISHNICNQSVVGTAGANDFLPNLLSYLYMASFGLIIMSILCAIIIIYALIGLWQLEWKYIGHMNPVIEHFYKNRGEALTDEEFLSQIERVKSPLHIHMCHIERINTFFKIHVSLLVAGILCFYFVILFQ
jgi:large-conductance mechanosensitive channel